MIAFADLTHFTDIGYVTIRTQVNVIELTHQKSAHKRAIIEYIYKGQLRKQFISLSRLTF